MSGSSWPYAAVALISGAALAFQVGFNAALRSRVGNPIVAALFSFLIGTAVLLGYLAVSRPPRPDPGVLARGPWWIWLGGVVGAGYVTSAAAFAPRLGAAGWLGLIVTGQVAASLAMDHFGLLGFPTRRIDGPRLAGAALLLAGIALVLRPQSR